MKIISRIDLVVMNRGSTPTFRRPGYRQTIVDITLATQNLAAQVKSWTVAEWVTASNHQYIILRIEKTKDIHTVIRRIPQKIKWNTNQICRETLTESLEKGISTLKLDVKKVTTSINAEAMIRKIIKMIRTACENAISRKIARTRRKPAYWWSSNIAYLRKNYLQLRRIAQRAKKNKIQEKKREL